MNFNQYLYLLDQGYFGRKCSNYETSRVLWDNLNKKSKDKVQPIKLHLSKRQLDSIITIWSFLQIFLYPNHAQKRIINSPKSFTPIVYNRNRTQIYRSSNIKSLEFLLAKVFYRKSYSRMVKLSVPNTQRKTSYSSKR